jgi:hypothetical protein
MAKSRARLVAVLSYISIIGWIIALIMNEGNRSALGSFHIRQSLLLMIALNSLDSDCRLDFDSGIFSVLDSGVCYSREAEAVACNREVRPAVI